MSGPKGPGEPQRPLWQSLQPLIWLRCSDSTWAQSSVSLTPNLTSLAANPPQARVNSFSSGTLQYGLFRNWHQNMAGRDHNKQSTSIYGTNEPHVTGW